MEQSIYCVIPMEHTFIAQCKATWLNVRRKGEALVLWTVKEFILVNQEMPEWRGSNTGRRR
jgi:hypothetical protein